MTSICIKCKLTYISDTQDAQVFFSALERMKNDDPVEYERTDKVYRDGYCASCLEVKIKVAKEIDEKMANVLTNSERVGIPRTLDLPHIQRGSLTLYNASDLGL